MLDFSRKFVTASKEYSTFTKHVPAPLFRRTFHLKKAPEKAAIRITGLGFYELFVNGKRLTKGLLAPYISNPDDVVYFDDYDLTPYLTEGENVIGVCLGNGMQNPFSYTWDFHLAKHLAAPKLAFYFEIYENEDFTAIRKNLYLKGYHTNRLLHLSPILSSESKNC